VMAERVEASLAVVGAHPAATRNTERPLFRLCASREPPAFAVRGTEQANSV
jgi:hypothetical protein